MNRLDVSWRGYWPAAPTPFDVSGQLVEDSFLELLGLYVSNGVGGILVNGSTGEWFSQTRAERKHLAEFAVNAVDGAVPVVIGVSAYTAREASDLARHAASAGADGILATPPPYVHPSPEEILTFYAEVSDATDLPFMVYNWPRGVAVDISAHPGLMEALAQLDRVVAIKDSSGSWDRVEAMARAVCAEVRVFGGFLNPDGLELLLAGIGDGNIDGGGVGAPFAVPLYEAVERGDRAGAKAALLSYMTLATGLVRSDYSARYASPIPQLKAVMLLLGQPGGEVRPPLLPLRDTASLAALRGVLVNAGLL